MSQERRRLRAAFQGERGAFSEEAGRRLLGADLDTLPCRAFEDMFAAVADGRADCAIVPVENTLFGPVVKNYDLLFEHDLTIVGEVVLRVVHNLIGLPGATIDDVRKVYSHPVALAQCERFLQSHPAFAVLQEYDTAGSVKLVLGRGNKEEAAIASALAAEVYGGQILAAGIESNPQNFTRFLILVRPDRQGDVAVPPSRAGQKTSLAFRIAHRPGGLHKALAAFAEEGIDLTKIESRPIEGRPWEYSFYLDIVGDRTDAAVQRALARLTALSESVRIFGSYPRAELAG